MGSHAKNEYMVEVLESLWLVMKDCNFIQMAFAIHNVKKAIMQVVIYVWNDVLRGLLNAKKEYVLAKKQSVKKWTCMNKDWKHPKTYEYNKIFWFDNGL